MCGVLWWGAGAVTQEAAVVGVTATSCTETFADVLQSQKVDLHIRRAQHHGWHMTGVWKCLWNE